MEEASIFGFSPMGFIVVCIVAFLFFGLGFAVMLQQRIKKLVKTNIFCIVRSADKKLEFALWPIENNKIKAPKSHGVPGGSYVTNNKTTGHCDYPPLLPSIFQTRASAVLLQKGDPEPIPFGAWDAKGEYKVGELPVITSTFLANIEREKIGEIMVGRTEEATKSGELSGGSAVAGLPRWAWILWGAIFVGVLFGDWLSIQAVNSVQYLAMWLGG